MRKKPDFITRLGEKLDIPRAIFSGSFGCVVEGTRELTVRGCRKILSYDPAAILLAVGGGTRLLIEGEALLFRAFGAGSVTLSGEIRSLTFQKEAE